MAEPVLDYVRDPAEIYRDSFATIADEVDLSQLPAEMAPVATRMIHACGMTDLVADLRSSEGAAAAGLRALAAGAPLVCDVRMVAAGLLRDRLAPATEVLVAIDAAGENFAGDTRSAAGMERLRHRLDGAVVVIGNAPTALFRLLEVVASGTPKPALVIGIPVGFVGAAEAKAALAANAFGIPYITVLGRRGGSAIAAAAVNALILEAQTAQAVLAKTAEKDTASLSSPRGEEREAPPWLSVVGIGEDGLAGLSRVARALVDRAEVLVGGERHLAMLPADGRERWAWPTPFSTGLDRLLTHRGRRVAVLATGDPMNFGIGATLARSRPATEMCVVPSASTFSLAAARLGWPLEETACVSLHGRPSEALALHVHPDARLLVLAHDGRTPGEVAEYLVAHGFGDSRITALAHMGGPRESRHEGVARTWTGVVPDFHTLAVACVAGPEARWWPRTAGLPDDAFVHDGKLTKREVRALALAKLMPNPSARLWDIGAGCGSIGIEWLRAAPGGSAIALEPLPERRAMAAQNAAVLGVPHLDLRDLTAPDGLAGLPEPDAVFIGGGISAATIAASTEALKPGGRLVAHAVTLESEAVLLSVYAERGGELVRLSVARAEPVGPLHGWRPGMPVTQWAWTKP